MNEKEKLALLDCLNKRLAYIDYEQLEELCEEIINAKLYSSIIDPAIELKKLLLLRKQLLQEESALLRSLQDYIEKEIEICLGKLLSIFINVLQGRDNGKIKKLVVILLKLVATTLEEIDK